MWSSWMLTMNNPGVSEYAENRNGLCRHYFFAGYSNEEMCAVLAVRHDIHIGTRQVMRVLCDMGLRRRETSTYRHDLNMGVSLIQSELSGSGSCLGYRSLRNRLRSKYGTSLPRDTVYNIQRRLDPEAVESRLRGRLSRRTYSNEGPNYLIHADGYDKLKKYGFAIHGAICGYSRRLLWLRVARTNNKPEVVASFFIDYVREIKGVPRCLRIDAGTENGLMANIQRGFRLRHTDTMARRSVIIGRSCHNQRIERWWGSLRAGGGQFWMDLFQKLELDGLFNTASSAHIELARFCFMEVLQKELDTFRVEWNQHTIRKGSSANCPSGKPDLMYFCPSIHDTIDYKTDVSEEDICSVYERFCEPPNPHGCEPADVRRLERTIAENGRSMPTNTQEAVALFMWLVG